LTQPEPAPHAEHGAGGERLGGRVVLLAGPDEGTNMVANYLDHRFGDVVLIVESPPSRVRMARRRVRRVGWVDALGQVLFVALALPALRHRGEQRRVSIREAASVDTRPRAPDFAVSSVNDDRTMSLLADLHPSIVVVHGTRIIAARLLNSLDCPVVNVHAGLTPRYRGVHGGYWALAEHHPEWVGTTVHLVDPGIDTGGILGQVTFGVTDEDSIGTYADLHLVHGLPLLAAQVEKAVEGAALEPVASSVAPGSCLHYHPTLWGYFRRRWSGGVR
jgi:folate-dependent phosphoribosylglycinamide formyltransferase PurN